MKALERLLELFLYERTCIAWFLHQQYIMRYWFLFLASRF